MRRNQKAAAQLSSLSLKEDEKPARRRRPGWVFAAGATTSGRQMGPLNSLETSNMGTGIRSSSRKGRAAQPKKENARRGRSSKNVWK